MARNDLPANAGSNGELQKIRSLVEMGDIGYNGPTHACNFDIHSESGMRRFMTAAGDAELRASDMDGEVFEMTHWLCEPAIFTDEGTGNKTTGCRVTLWDKQERRLTAASWAITRYLDRIVKLFGWGKLQHAIGLVFTNKIDRAGNRSYGIEMVEIPASITGNVAGE
jgi:hypothetical protein